MKIFRIYLLMIAMLTMLVSSVWSQEKVKIKKDSTFSGYESESTLGGARSVQNRLQKNNEIKDFRRDEKRSLGDKWYLFKKKVNNKTGLRFGINYGMTVMGASTGVNDSSEKEAYGGVLELDFYKRIIGKNSLNKGSINMIMDWRHAYPGSIAPATLHIESGSYVSPAVEFTSYSFRPIELFYHQVLFNGIVELAIGKIDPFNFYTQHPLINGFTDFQNAGFSISSAAAWPTSGMGGVLGLTLLKNRNLFLKIGIHDIIGDPLEDYSWFSFGDELLEGRSIRTYEVVWARSHKEELTNSMSITYWNADEITRENKFGEEILISSDNQGMAFNFNWLFDDAFQAVIAGGYSKGGEEGLAKNYIVLAHSYQMNNGDAVGTGVNWFDPISDERAQTTMEVYYRYRASRFTSLTPTFQWVINPSRNEQVNHLFYVGIRLRLTF
ncbi:MAG: carbohydrate porin [Reichenbachiella sp.]